MKTTLFCGLILCSSSVFSGVHVRNLWPSNDVRVCFAAGEEGKRLDRVGHKLNIKDWKQSRKDKVQNWVMEEFTPERTGIHFVGWNECEEDPMAEVMLFYNKNSKLKNFFFGGVSGFATMGPKPGIVLNYPQALGSITINSSGMNKVVVIHEFGHSAGLGHEHQHKDAKKSCSMVEPTIHDIYEYVPYDADSIMSYCNIGRKDRGLSLGDIDLLKTLYP